jgi:hypothetical protein
VLTEERDVLRLEIREDRRHGGLLGRSDVVGGGLAKCVQMSRISGLIGEGKR